MVWCCFYETIVLVVRETTNENLYDYHWKPEVLVVEKQKPNVRPIRLGKNHMFLIWIGTHNKFIFKKYRFLTLVLWNYVKLMNGYIYIKIREIWPVVVYLWLIRKKFRYNNGVWVMFFTESLSFRNSYSNAYK